jgi:hypothetical protein
MRPALLLAELRTGLQLQIAVAAACDVATLVAHRGGDRAAENMSNVLKRTCQVWMQERMGSWGVARRQNVGPDSGLVAEMLLLRDILPSPLNWY